MEWFDNLRGDISRYIGQTVTIFTTSGGKSGSGFSGVLISVSDCAVRLLVSAREAPNCPLGSSCSGFNNLNNNFSNNNCNCNNPLGAIVIIPTSSIAAFTHNAI